MHQLLLMLHIHWNILITIIIFPLLLLGGKTPLSKTRLSMACEFSWLHSRQHTSPQNSNYPQANWALTKGHELRHELICW